MGKRKLFLLFLSAMSVSIIIMVVIYGLFIKDLDFTFNVKNPESAPSPEDIFEEASEAPIVEGEKQPAKVTIPEQESPKLQENAEVADNLPEQDTEPVTELVPLEPQVGQTEEMPPIPGMEGYGTENGSSPSETVNNTPSLHYVYLDGFSSRESAEQALQQLQGRGLVAQPYIRQHRGQIILQFGVFSDRENAEAMANQLRNQSVFVKVD